MHVGIELGPQLGELESLEQTGCCRSDLTGECRRTPIPDVGQFLGRLSAAPRNTTFGGGMQGQVTRLGTRFGQRLPPLAAIGHCRPIPAHQISPKPPDDLLDILSVRIYEAAVRDHRRSAISGYSRPAAGGAASCLAGNPPLSRSLDG